MSCASCAAWVRISNGSRANDRRRTFRRRRDAPLNLEALDAEDLQVISSLAQDAVFPAIRDALDPGAPLCAAAEPLPLGRRGAARQRAIERVQSVLVVNDVHARGSQGVTSDADTVLSLLALRFDPGR